MSRRSCLGCGLELPPPFIDLGLTPLANSLVDPSDAGKTEERFPLAVALCSSCSLAQLTQTIPPGKLYSDYLYFSSFSEFFLDHARRMADDLSARFQLTADSRVLEIASNDGYLLQFFKQKGIKILGVEPASNIASEAVRKGIPTLNRFFGPAVVAEIRAEFGLADLIIGNNVLAHVPVINEFLAAVTDCLAPGGTASFEFPSMRRLLEKTEFDTIYHEHVFYLTLTAVAGLAKRAGLEIFDVQEQAVHGGSLRVLLQRAGARPPMPAVALMLSEEKAHGLGTPAPYALLNQRVIALREDLRALLLRLRSEGARVAAYGAPAKGNTLLNYCGLGTGEIGYSIDRSPHKQGKLLPGTHIPILAPERLRSERPDYLLILPWNIKDEIIEQTSFIREWGGRHIIPIPKVEILS